MKFVGRSVRFVLLACLGAVLSSCATRNPFESDFGAAHNASDRAAGGSLEPGWPQVVARGSTTNLIYEPQADSWDGHKLLARAVVVVWTPGQARPTSGVVGLQAITLVDKTSRTVTLEDVQVIGGAFPSLAQHIQGYLEKLRPAFPRELAGISLDRLQESLAIAPQQLSSTDQRLNNAPPRIIFDTKPTLLVIIDGLPAYRPVPGTGLQRVINTRPLLLRDAAGQFYLHLLDSYMQASSLNGPWTVSAQPPTGAAEAERQAIASATPPDLLLGQTDSSTSQPPPLTASTAPGVYVSTTPAELILFDGEPDYVRIGGTHLLYAANTTGNVFKLLSDQHTYVLISGRWFRAPGLAGPWQFVPANHLRQDFAAIPDNSPKENVKASVAGTPQATEALIDNTIPEGTKVRRDTQMQDSQIDGPPQLAPIDGTPLHYVVNSGTPIIEVDAHSWYACQNGLWFVATSLGGPWVVADSVPAVIYSIPPDSPLHYVTYVQVFGAAPQEVYEGYTPGYLGTEVEDGVVVYGTGYDYAPWLGAVWYAAPCTWGLGWGPCWTPWDDWCFDFGFGWVCGFGGFDWRHCHPPHPWWGPCRGWHGERGLLAWGRSDSTSTAGNELARGYARAYNSRTGHLAAGQGAGVPLEHRTLDSRDERIAYWGYGPSAARGENSASKGKGRFGAWTATRPVSRRYAPKSPYAKVGSRNMPSGYGHRGFYAGHDGGRSSGYFTGGSYSHGVGHSGGGWGGGHGGGGGHR